jgi:hypothetical protein
MSKRNQAEKTGRTALEHGDIFFFYHPKADRAVVEGPEDLASFHLILHPLDSNTYRYAVISLLGLLENGGETGWWARLEVVESELSQIQRKLRDTHPLPPARPCGEGVYSVVRHGRHTHLAYALELPEEPGEVQKALGISHLENAYLAVLNPFFEAREESGLSPLIKTPDYPEDLLNLFGDRRFHSADPVRLLDYEGAEILIARRPVAQIEELETDLMPEHETVETAEVFRLLKVRADQVPVTPLFEGHWA